MNSTLLTISVYASRSTETGLVNPACFGLTFKTSGMLNNFEKRTYAHEIIFFIRIMWQCSKHVQKMAAAPNCTLLNAPFLQFLPYCVALAIFIVSEIPQ